MCHCRYKKGKEDTQDDKFATKCYNLAMDKIDGNRRQLPKLPDSTTGDAGDQSNNAREGRESVFRVSADEVMRNFIITGNERDMTSFKALDALCYGIGADKKKVREKLKEAAKKKTIVFSKSCFNGTSRGRGYSGLAISMDAVNVAVSAAGAAAKAAKDAMAVDLEEEARETARKNCTYRVDYREEFEKSPQAWAGIVAECSGRTGQVQVVARSDPPPLSTSLGAPLTDPQVADANHPINDAHQALIEPRAPFHEAHTPVFSDGCHLPASIADATAEDPAAYHPARRDDNMMMDMHPNEQKRSACTLHKDLDAESDDPMKRGTTKKILTGNELLSWLKSNVDSVRWTDQAVEKVQRSMAQMSVTLKEKPEEGCMVLLSIQYGCHVIRRRLRRRHLMFEFAKEADGKDLDEKELKRILDLVEPKNLKRPASQEAGGQ